MPYEQESALGAGFGAAAGFLGGMQQGQDRKAEAQRQAEIDRQHALATAAAQQHVALQDKAEQARLGLDQQRFGLDQQKAADEKTERTNSATLAAKHEADQALHQAHADALAQARVQLQITKDHNAYVVAEQKIKQSYDRAALQAKTATTVAEIHSSAEIGAANIRASATLQAAGMHEAGADRRADARNAISTTLAGMRDTTARRGQDLTAGGKASAINAQNDRARSAAMAKLASSANAPQVPTTDEDPKFGMAVQQFMNDSPAERAKLYANPNVPAATKAYLQALAPFIAASPGRVSVPTTSEDDDDDL